MVEPARHPKIAPLLISAIVCHVCVNGSSAHLRSPPMGWMSWLRFGCDIEETLFYETAEAMSSKGYREAGYVTVSMDDCWMARTRTELGVLEENRTRFPRGIRELSNFVHGLGLRLGSYLDIGTSTCEGFPGTKNYIQEDATLLDQWNIDYIKVDACAEPLQDCSTDYAALGAALSSLKRQVVFSCSWPAYLGDDETSKPFDQMIASKCNTWRNWHDIQCNWRSLISIIDHFGNYSAYLAHAVNGTSTFHDMDMLIIGNKCVSAEEERAQMAIWSIMASPLIMGNDLRSIPDESARILLNKDVIYVNQDPSPPGLRISSFGAQELWSRPLSNGSVAVVVLNKLDSTSSYTLDMSRVRPDHAHSGNVVVLRDLFAGSSRTTTWNANLTISIQPRSVVMLRVDPLASPPGLVQLQV